MSRVVGGVFTAMATSFGGVANLTGHMGSMLWGIVFAWLAVGVFVFL